jgi:cell division septation protein DedD
LSPDHESSYYEIALTNRQVLTIFVVLLTCLVAAFLSGVWIGRRDDGQGTPEVSAGEPPAAEAAAEMTELNFFSEGSPRQRQVEKEAARQPRPPAEEPAADQPVPPPPVAERRPPPAAEEPPPAPRPAVQTPAPGRVIQVFSTPDAAQADKLVRRLGDGGYPAYLVRERLQGRTTYRVRVGPYEQEAAAEKVADELRREYRLETWITSQPG